MRRGILIAGAFMSQPSDESRAPRLAWADSAWFWVMAFCVAGALALLVISPKYAARQRRLEMQYQARREIERRQHEGDSGPRERGEEGEAPPPAPGELIISLWPLLALFAVLGLVSAVMWWRTIYRRPASGGAEPPPGGPRTNGNAI